MRGAVAVERRGRHVATMLATAAFGEQALLGGARPWLQLLLWIAMDMLTMEMLTMEMLTMEMLTMKMLCVLYSLQALLGGAKPTASIVALRFCEITVRSLCCCE